MRLDFHRFEQQHVKLLPCSSLYTCGQFSGSERKATETKLLHMYYSHSPAECDSAFCLGLLKQILNQHSLQLVLVSHLPKTGQSRKKISN